MLVELKDKVALPTGAAATGLPLKQGVVKDALSALVNLGYTRSIAEEAVHEAARRQGNELSLEELLKESLRLLARQ
jgi:Holliday junction resolvasome RuvABC DNA-binding subunit